MSKPHNSGTQTAVCSTSELCRSDSKLHVYKRLHMHKRMDIHAHIHMVCVYIYICTDHSEEATKEPNAPTYSRLPDQGAELPMVA